MPEIKTISSWSGGKDSCLACYKATQQGYKVERLLNFVSREFKRGCFHGLEHNLMRRQAELIDIPLVQYEVSPDMSRYEEEFKAAVRAQQSKGIEAMVFGDIYLLEHQGWVERVCREIAITALEPLWNLEPEGIIREFVAAGFKAVIVSCKADAMGEEFLGREVDLALAQELKKIGVCPCGEKGEYHTLVVDGPIFKQPLKILQGEPLLKEGFWKHWYLDIKKFS
jgi:uncharacterized protein (TIGR00290 family)